MKGSRHYFYAGVAATPPSEGYRFFIRRGKQPAWEGFLFRFATRRDRDAWVALDRDRKALPKMHPAVVHAHLVRRMHHLGEWTRAWKRCPAERWVCTRKLTWPR